MTIKRTTWQYWAAASWMVFTVALASWWLIFGLSQARQLGALEGPDAAQVGRVARMLVFEGAVLVGMLVAGGVALLVAIRLEQRRRRDLRSFFMAFTHDLKTSLTSLRLQAEALREDLPEAAANPNLQRMLKDSVRLQLQLENALALTTADGAVFIEAIEHRARWSSTCARIFPSCAIELDRRRAACAPIAARSRACCAICCRTRSCTDARRASRSMLRRSTSGASRSSSTDDGSGANGGSVDRARSAVRAADRDQRIGRRPVRVRPAAASDARRRSACSATAAGLRRQHRAAGGGLMPRVLLVEDDRSLGRTLAERLEKEGLDVSGCRRSQARWRAARSGTWDLAIVDVMLPDGSGFDLARQIQRPSLHADHVHDRAQLRREPARPDSSSAPTSTCRSRFT